MAQTLLWSRPLLAAHCIFSRGFVRGERGRGGDGWKKESLDTSSVASVRARAQPDVHVSFVLHYYLPTSPWFLLFACLFYFVNYLLVTCPIQATYKLPFLVCQRSLSVPCICLFRFRRATGTSIPLLSALRICVRTCSFLARAFLSYLAQLQRPRRLHVN